jgi:peptidoglycan/LPS O-acetylase OafA/YrhL
MKTSKIPDNFVWLSSLRAFGVVLVLVYHFFPELLPGGFIGVDIFFVFSGYLITSLLVREFKYKGKIEILSFYKRRIRRLLPALIFMLISMIPLSLLLNADFRVGIMQQSAAALSWVTNIYEIANGSSYANNLLPHLFVHTWTLSIEMQYYLVWALVVSIILLGFRITTKSGLFSIKIGEKVLARILVVAIITSYALMQIFLLGAEDPSMSYFSTLSHVYPLLIGSLLGVLAGFSNTRLVQIAARVESGTFVLITVLLLVLMVLMSVFLNFESPQTFWYGILATSLCTALIILLGRAKQPQLARHKEPRIFTYLSERSYSIYLFHWPLFIIFSEFAANTTLPFSEDLRPAFEVCMILLAIILTFVFSHISYKFVETKFRRSSKLTNAIKVASNVNVVDDLKPTNTESNASASNADIAKTHKLQGFVYSLATLALAVLCVVTFVQTPGKSSIQSSIEQESLKLDIAELKGLALLLKKTNDSPINGANSTKNLPYKPSYLAGLTGKALKDAENKQAKKQMALRASMGESGIEGGINVIGDSVCLGAASAIKEHTGADVDAEGSRTMKDGFQVVKKMAEDNTLNEYVVLALASNTSEESEEYARKIIQAIGPGHRIIFVTAHGPYPGEKRVNDYLKTLPPILPFVVIADWDKAIQGKEKHMSSDGIHCDDDVSKGIYAQTIANAILEAKEKPTS